jgi:hypothetical protein
MVAHKLLLIVIIGAGLLSAVNVPSSAAAQAMPCAPDLAAAGLCAPPEASGEFNNGGVDLSAGVGSGGGGGAADDQDDGDSVENDVDVVLDQPGADGVTPGIGGPPPIVRDGVTVNCAPGSPCDPNLVVRISDLVNIRPVAASPAMEPSGWMVVGLPANFITAASAHIRSGMLLGFPADVRFTPAGFRWEYGDGSTGVSRSGGSTWAAQGVPEFSETATSHTFTQRGRFTITAAVVYTAEYRFAGQSWRSIAGTLTVPEAPFTALAGDARTVLVDRDCSRDRRGPGC